jgi:hypothetical protein
LLDLYLLEMRSVIAPRSKSCSSLCLRPHIVLHFLVPLHLHFELQLQLQILFNIEILLRCDPWQEPQWLVNLTTFSCEVNGMPSSETSVMMKRPSSFLFGPHIPRAFLLLDDDSWKIKDY